MAKLDTDRIWRSLGTFWDLFPQEERIYLTTFWEAYADIVADLWGLAFQVDRSKSIFSTTATFERRNVLVQFSGLQQQPSFEFALSSVQTTPTGAIVVRGFVPRERRTIKAADIPAQGLIRIGSDTLRYIFVNVISFEGGPFDGYVREATFTLADATIPHDYRDSVDMNDSFFKTEVELAFRVDQVPTQGFVDATSNGVALDLNPTGRIKFGTPGLNFEEVQYQSLTVVGDRYVFSLPVTWGPAQSAPVELLFAHPLGEQILASVLSPSRWAISASGPARVYGDDAAVFVIDHEPGALGAAAAAMTSQIQVRENSNFDLAVSLFTDNWPSVASSERRAGVRLQIGATTYTLHLSETSAGFAFVGGTEDAPEEVLGDTAPSQVELRLARTGATLELSVRTSEATDFTLIASVTATGERAVMSLFAEDDGSDTPARVRFDEVVRRLGEAAGSTRLESSFIVDDLFPYRYTTDVQLASATALRDRPRLRSENLITVEAVEETDAQYIRAIGSGDEFESEGVPVAGEIVIDDVVVVYDEVTRDGVTLEFKVRGKLDPDLLPIAAGTSFRARTRELVNKDLFKFPAPGQMWLRDLPTRDRMWAPVAQEDQRHVQRMYGPLVGLDAEASSDAYLRRVQGAWYALMSGPAIENIRIGVHLTMGLPVAQVTGVVQSTSVKRNVLGEIEERTMIILGNDGAVTHRLNPTIQGIDWIFEPGERVERFTPLTQGVEVFDAIRQDDWPVLFGLDETSPERYNAFGVLVDMDVLNADTSLDDAIRFALRIKPTWAKMYFHLLLTAGNETINIEDDMLFASLMLGCEDLSFPEGDGPPPEQDYLRMGDGHRMGQGKRMGISSVFQPFPALGIGLFMGTGLTMGMDPRAYCCAPDADNPAAEQITATPVIEVDTGA